jgi:hypothetical protein
MTKRERQKLRRLVREARLRIEGASFMAGYLSSAAGQNNINAAYDAFNSTFIPSELRRILERAAYRRDQQIRKGMKA